MLDAVFFALLRDGVPQYANIYWQICAFFINLHMALRKQISLDLIVFLAFFLPEGALCVLPWKIEGEKRFFVFFRRKEKYCKKIEKGVYKR